MLTTSERFNGSSHLPKPLCENTSLNSVTHALASVSYCFHSIKGSKVSQSLLNSFFLLKEVLLYPEAFSATTTCVMETYESTLHKQWSCWSDLPMLPHQQRYTSTQALPAVQTASSNSELRKSNTQVQDRWENCWGPQLIKVLRNQMRLDLRSCITQRVLLSYWQGKAL